MHSTPICLRIHEDKFENIENIYINVRRNTKNRNRRIEIEQTRNIFNQDCNNGNNNHYYHNDNNFIYSL